MKYSDTIAAISTSVSPSGIGIVRMTGDEAFKISDEIYRSKSNKRLCNQKTHTIHYGYIVDGDCIIDEVLVMLMKGPHSYTGEDTVEINCHGGVYVVKRILETAIKYGARLAEPGEFTKRAFLNGRLDLSQAEAVADIISSENESSLQSSISQLKGNIKKKIDEFRSSIIYHIAFIESALDDPEHINIDGYADKLRKDICRLSDEILQLLSSYDDGRIIKEGIKTVILGKPNAGKSSLLNLLVGEERAIVTEIAGTTRDILEEHINLQGISLNIIDTAGIRNTDNIVEKIGIDKAKEHAGSADLIIYVMDASTPFDKNDEEILRMIQGKQSIILLNKSDLDMIVTKKDIESMNFEFNLAKNIPVIEVSARENYGIKEFERKVKDMFFEGNLSFDNKIYITNVRHKNALQGSYCALQKVKESIDAGMPEDFYSIDLIDAYESLGKITGETMGEDLANEIFSKFCMGK